MARWIGEGKILPIVHFQLPYIGAVEQYPLALLMRIAGDDVSTVNVFYFSLSALSLLFSFCFYRRILGDAWANFAFVLLSLPLPLVLLFSLQSYSFGGLILLESVSLWFLVSFLPSSKSPLAPCLLGLINGLALYNNILSIGFLCFTMWLVFATRSWRGFSLCLVGFLVGYSPMLYFNLTNEFISYQMLVAKFLGVTKEMVEAQGVILGGLNGFGSKISGQGPKSDLAMLFGFPAFFSGRGYLLLITCLVIALGLIVLALFRPNRKPNDLSKGWSLLPSSSRSVFVGCSIVTAVLAVSQVRYLTAIIVPFPVLICEGLIVFRKCSKRGAIALGFLLVLFLVVGHTKVLSEDSATHQDEFAPVFDRLEEKRLTHGYGSYQFQAYSAFLSNSKVKVSPQIGPLYLDKIPSYSRAVDQEDDVFYIVPADSSYLAYLFSNSISFRIEKLQTWWIIWGLSQRVFPKSLLPERELSRTDGYARWSYRENPSVLNVYRGGH